MCLLKTLLGVGDNHKGFVENFMLLADGVLINALGFHLGDALALAVGFFDVVRVLFVQALDDAGLDL